MQQVSEYECSSNIFDARSTRGEDVVVAYGHAARVALEELGPNELPTHPVDAAVVAIVDRHQVYPDAARRQENQA